MGKLQKDALQASKEIVVKFIEAGRISPSNFADIFPGIFDVVLKTIATAEDTAVAPQKEPPASGQQVTIIRPAPASEKER